jgi:HEAT repeat protein
MIGAGLLLYGLAALVVFLLALPTALEAAFKDPKPWLDNLKNRLQDSNPETRRTAALSLPAFLEQFDAEVRKEMINKALPVWIDALTDQDEKVREGGAWTILALAPDNADMAVPVLLAKVDPRDHKEMIERCSAALRDKDPHQRTLAAFFLGHLGPEARGATPALVTVLKDENERVRAAAATALKRIDPEAAARAGVP